MSTHGGSGGGGSGTIEDITSTSFTITDPTGPTTDIDGPLLANLAAGGFKLTDLANGSTSGDSLAYGQALLLTGGTMSGAIAMGSNKITGLTNGSAAQDAAAFGQITTAGKLLQRVQYYANTTYTTTSTSFAVVDATHLTISFTAPPSGSILMRLTGLVAALTSSSNSVNYALFDHVSTSTQYGNANVAVAGAGVTIPSIAGQYSTPILVTGLTPGTVYQMDWSWACGVGADTASMYLGTTMIGATMECYAA